MDQYREGKVKSTSNRRVKEYLKPCAYKRSEHESVTACLLHNEPTSYRICKVKGHETCSRSESESEEGVESVAVDAKPSDLPLARMKSG